MNVSSMRDLLITQIEWLFAIERHSAAILPVLADASTNGKLDTLLRSNVDDGMEHLSRLEKVCGQIGVTPSNLQNRDLFEMKRLVAECADLCDMSPDYPHVADAAIIGLVQHIEHIEIAGYACARTWANLLRFEHVCQLLQFNLNDEKKVDAKLTKLAEAISRLAIEDVSV